MPKIDETRPFIAVGIAVLTVSDTRAVEDDRSGGSLVQMLGDAGHRLAGRAIVKDDVSEIRAKVQAWIADPIHTVCLILMLGAAFYHSKLGIQVVIEDYVHQNFWKYALLLLNILFSVAFALLGIVAVLKLHFAGVAA